MGGRPRNGSGPGRRGKTTILSSVPGTAGNWPRATSAVVQGHHEGGRHRENWTPRELGHTFVSILSDNEVSIEAIADLCGHRSTIVTQKVYRHQLRPVMTKGATTLNTIFTSREEHRTA